MEQRLKSLEKFHKAFKLPYNKKLHEITYEDVKLRINLIQEELDELKKAAQVAHWEEVLDALCDLEYVLLGTVVQFGMQDVFQEAFEAVHKSNMTKIVPNYEEALKERDHYCFNKDVDCYVEKTEGGFIIIRSSDGKILKPRGYTPVNLGIFLEVLYNR